jgi:hypothetical protein
MKLVHIKKGEDYIDRAFSAEHVVQAIPAEAKVLTETASVRQMNDRIRAEGQKFGPFTHVMTMPRAMLAVWQLDDPRILQDKRRFWRRARKHRKLLTRSPKR